MYDIPSGVTALSFDIWKTLLNSRGSFTWPRLKLVFGEVGILHYGQESITDAYKKAEKHLNHQAEITGYDTGMAERIQMVFDELGVDKPLPSYEIIGSLQRRSAEIRLQPPYLPELTEPGLVQTLESLKAAGYKLGVLSNTGMGDCNMSIPILKHLGLYELFDTTLFSCEDGRAKPNPGFFHRMAEELEAKPDQVLHIGDNANADYRATEAGLHAVLYAPDGSELTHIRSMRELLQK